MLSQKTKSINFKAQKNESISQVIHPRRIEDRPILFNEEMIVGILEHRKECTRRIVKNLFVEPDGKFFWKIKKDQVIYGYSIKELKDVAPLVCPYGQVGDLLWVKEKLEKANGEAIGYPADGSWLPNTPWRWKREVLPSIHMPKALSRITLIIKEIRIERLKDITEQDAINEGIKIMNKDPYGTIMWKNYNNEWTQFTHTPIGSFLTLWESINGKGSWDENPWVWVIHFEPVSINIDNYIRERNEQVES